MKAQHGCFYSPVHLKRAFGKQEISENSNSVRKDLLANTAFHGEEMSGIFFISESLMPVGVIKEF